MRTIDPVVLVALFLAGGVFAEEPKELKSDPPAKAFGAAPAMWNVQLSRSRTGKTAELIEYENAEHNIVPERYRIDMLTRLGEFLRAHIGE